MVMPLRSDYKQMDTDCKIMPSKMLATLKLAWGLLWILAPFRLYLQSIYSAYTFIAVSVQHQRVKAPVWQSLVFVLHGGGGVGYALDCSVSVHLDLDPALLVMYPTVNTIPAD